jgi:uncharacterized peroxidase-related enzyme
MAFIETIAPADAEGDVRSMYARQQQAWGFVPNYARVFCWRPEVMARWGRLLAEIRRPMDDRRFELVTFAAALALKHTGCSLVHGKALAGFVGDDAVRAIASGEDSEDLSDADRALVRFARKVALDAAAIAPEDVEELRCHGLTEPEIFDVAATAAGRAFFTKLLDALGVETEAGSGGMSKELRGMLTVGRAMDPRPPEVMPA